MFQPLVTGNGFKKKSAVLALHAFLTSDEAKLLNRGTDRGLAELTLQAIWLQLKGKPVTEIELASDGIDHFKSKQSDAVLKVASIFNLPDGNKQA
jgi:hypothetical protein